jgi:hypothetical protein
VASYKFHECGKFAFLRFRVHKILSSIVWQTVSITANTIMNIIIVELAYLNNKSMSATICNIKNYIIEE